MSVEVQILSLSQATSEGFLAWRKLLGTRLHLPTAYLDFWTQCWSTSDLSLPEEPSREIKSNRFRPSNFQASWKFVFVYRHEDHPNLDSHTTKRSVIGILPFKLIEKKSLQNGVNNDAASEKRVGWLKAKRDRRPQKVLQFSDSLEFGGGPIGNQPTATLMATFRYLNGFLPEDTVWEISLQNPRSPLASRFDTVLKQFPARFHRNQRTKLGWVLRLQNQKQLEKLQQYFLIEHLEVSRTLTGQPFGDQEVFLQSKDYRLIGKHAYSPARSCNFPTHLFDRNQPRHDLPDQQDLYQVFIPDKTQTKPEPGQTDWQGLKNLAKTLDLPEWTGTKTTVSSANFWQRLFSTQIASH